MACSETPTKCLVLGTKLGELVRVAKWPVIRDLPRYRCLVLGAQDRRDRPSADLRAARKQMPISRLLVKGNTNSLQN
jgi:hypothetical protein